MFHDLSQETRAVSIVLLFQMRPPGTNSTCTSVLFSKNCICCPLFRNKARGVEAVTVVASRASQQRGSRSGEESPSNVLCPLQQENSSRRKDMSAVLVVAQPLSHPLPFYPSIHSRTHSSNQPSIHLCITISLSLRASPNLSGFSLCLTIYWTQFPLPSIHPSIYPSRATSGPPEPHPVVG